MPCSTDVITSKHYILAVLYGTAVVEIMSGMQSLDSLTKNKQSCYLRLL